MSGYTSNKSYNQFSGLMRSIQHAETSSFYRIKSAELAAVPLVLGSDPNTAESDQPIARPTPTERSAPAARPTPAARTAPTERSAPAARPTPAARGGQSQPEPSLLDTLKENEWVRGMGNAWTTSGLKENPSFDTIMNFARNGVGVTKKELGEGLTSLGEDAVEYVTTYHPDKLPGLQAAGKRGVLEGYLNPVMDSIAKHRQMINESPWLRFMYFIAPEYMHQRMFEEIANSQQIPEEFQGIIKERLLGMNKDFENAKVHRLFPSKESWNTFIAPGLAEFLRNNKWLANLLQPILGRYMQGHNVYAMGLPSTHGSAINYTPSNPMMTPGQQSVDYAGRIG